MSSMRRRLLAAAAALPFALLCRPEAAFSQQWPTKSVRVIVPYAPGGGLDSTARLFTQRLGERLSQQFVVENRTGGSGRIGAETVARSAPDGYTLLAASPAETVIAPAIGQKLTFDPRKDLMPVALLGETAIVVAAHPSVPAGNLAELLALAKTRKLEYGTPGIGSAHQFAGVMLEILGKVELLHVPYRGAAPSVTDALGGQIPLVISGLPPAVPHIKSGRLKAIAVTSATRASALPDVAAVAEAPGFQGYRFTNWFALFAPAGTPQPIVDQLAGEVARIAAEPAVREALAAQGTEASGMRGAEFKAFLDGEFQTYARIAKDRNIKVED